MDRVIDIINIAGLCFGLAGAIMVFIFGIPKRIDTGGRKTYVTKQTDPDEIKKINQCKFFGNLGLILIILFLILEKIRGKSLSLKAERVVNKVGMTLIMSLAVFVTYNDIVKNFGEKISKFFIK